MALPVLVALATVGIVAGFVSGLVGVGGGVLIVPFLYFFYAHPEWAGEAISSALEASIAHATSLFIIVPTAVLGTIAYARAQLVAWRAAVPIALVSILSAAIGANVALRLPGDVLKLAFGAFLLFTSWQLIGRKAHLVSGPLRLNLAVTVPCGLLVGLLSAMLGVGGGIVAIPLLIHVVRLDIQRVAATSLAVVTVAATAGTLTYIASGWNDPRLPAGSLGYVHATAAVPILLGSILTVRLGAWTNQQLGERTLRWIFGVLFLVLGLRLIWQSISALAG
jgi:uncharacterized membrane protein YfcA